MNTPPIVSPQDWKAAREELLVKEKELTRARDALAAERRRMPRMEVEKDYRFEGPNGPASLHDLLAARRQLIVYRFFFEPGVAGCPMPAVAAARWSPTRSRTSPIRTPATHHGARAPGGVGGLARGLPADPGLRVVEPPRRVRRGDRVRARPLGDHRLAARREEQVSVLAHVGGVPLEEIVPSLAGAGGSLLLARAWLSAHLRRRRDRGT